MKRNVKGSLILAIAGLLFNSSIASQANTFTVLHNFGGALPNGQTDGNTPLLQLVPYGDGFLGACYYGGQNSAGTLFGYSPFFNYRQLLSFDNTTVNQPSALIRGADGLLYGLSYGPSPNGEFFRVNVDGSTTVLYTFTGGADGSYPLYIALGPDANFYVLTMSSNFGANNGSFVRLDRNGHAKVLYVFPDAQQFIPGGLVYGNNGKFYTTADQQGTVLSLTLDGAPEVVHSYTQTGLSGINYPQGNLAIGPDGALYGTTATGGEYSGGTLFRIDIQHKSASGYPYETIHEFNWVEGASPIGVTEGPDGNLYGSAYDGGVHTTGYTGNFGTLFRFEPGKPLTVLHVADPMTGYSAGEFAGLFISPFGTIYGTYNGGGVDNGGALFAIDVNGPRMDAVEPASIQAGTAFTVKVHGCGFTRGSQVTWQGSPVSTTFVSDREIDAAISADLNPPVFGYLDGLFFSFGIPVYPNAAAVGVLNPDGTDDGYQTIKLTEAAPVLTSISPSTTVAGSGPIWVALAGNGFENNSVVLWNGTPLPAADVSPYFTNQLLVNLDASLLTQPGTATVSVYNPDTGITTAPLTFTITGS